MNRWIAVLLSSLAMISHAAAESDNDRHVEESKVIVKEFFTQLKGELGQAMQQGGPVHAIGVCNKSAPAIARALADKYGWEVARTSLKTRNRANAPDAWEETVLKLFEERRAAGESPATMSHHEIVVTDAGREFRFMQAIGMPPLTEMPCLKCHGEHIEPALGAKLDELYPQDKARGYKAGEIRGAFTLTRALD